MNFKQSKLSVLSALSAVAMLLGGCESTTAQPAPSRALNVQAAASFRLQVKGLQQGEICRRYVSGDDGNQLWISYSSGQVVYKFLREDGTCREARQTYPSPNQGVVQSRTYYAADGSTVLAREQYRTNGVLQQRIKLLPGGATEKRLFWNDGKRLFAVIVESSPGVGNATMYREDGKTIWETLQVDSNQKVHVEQFAANGKVHLCQDLENNSLTITYLKPDGLTISYKQIVAGGQLMEIWEYESNGKTLSRKLYVGYRAKSVLLVAIYTKGVKTSLRTLNQDATLQKEDFLDATGNSERTVQYEPGKGPKETFDAARLKLAKDEDPFEYYQAHNQ